MRDCRTASRVRGHLSAGRGRGRGTVNTSSSGRTVNHPSGAAAARDHGRGRVDRGGTSSRLTGRAVNFISMDGDGDEHQEFEEFEDETCLLGQYAEDEGESEFVSCLGN